MSRRDIIWTWITFGVAVLINLLAACYWWGIMSPTHD